MQTEEIKRVPLGDVKTHPALQPRDPALLSARDRVRQEDQSEAHARDMAELLKADPRAELVPVRLAEIGGALYVVDGHHRLRAYKRAKRESIPARAEPMTWRQAGHESKLANVSHAKMEMRPAQKRNALWHHLAEVTDYGNRSLPAEVKLKATAGRFGVSLNTLKAMTKRLPKVDPKEYPREQRDPITGWPHWKAVTTTVGDMYRVMPEASRADWKARKAAEGLARLVERWGPEAVAEGAALLRSEQVDPDAQTQAQEAARAVAEALGPVDF